MRRAASTAPRSEADGCFSATPLKADAPVSLSHATARQAERGSWPVTSASEEQDPLRSEAVDWLIRIQAAPGDATLRAGLDDWLAASAARRRAYGSVEKVWRLTGALPVAAPGVVSLAAARTSRMRRAAALAMAALAACIALYFLPALQLRLAADHMTGVAELRELRLDDGSTVHLDAGSAIAVNYEASRRQVTLLAGQAFFQVVRATDRPFVVTAGDVTITVTGTAFDVRASNDGVAVAVQSGSIDVATSRGDRHAATLMRGQRLTIDRGGA
ncbi:MAG: DUF4880 domain-containing protein, partial [Reyranella sp.]